MSDINLKIENKLQFNKDEINNETFLFNRDKFVDIFEIHQSCVEENVFIKQDQINEDLFLFIMDKPIDIFELYSLQTQDKDLELNKKFNEKLFNDDYFDDEDIEDDFEEDYEEDFEDEEDFTYSDKKCNKIIDELTLNEDSKVKIGHLENAVIEYRNGNDEAFNYIYEHYRPIMKRYSERTNNYELGIEFLDIVLLNAVRTFNENVGTKFNTYFWRCARGHAACHNKMARAQKRAADMNSMSLEENISDKNSSELKFEKIIDDKNVVKENRISELKLVINSFENILTKNEKIILLKLIDNYTLEEIGKTLGITAAAVCMAAKRIAKKEHIAKHLREVLMG